MIRCTREKAVAWRTAPIIMMMDPVAMLLLRPRASPKKEVTTEPRKHPTDRNNEADDRGTGGMKGIIECSTVDESAKQAIVTDESL
ncbi:hypothetical protein RBB50_007950 [Rhinocladiella similis]